MGILRLSTNQIRIAKSVKMFRASTLLVLSVIVAITLAGPTGQKGPVKDCSVCAADFKADLAVCGNLSIANLIKCVEDIIKSGKDCEHCVCDIVKIFSKDADC